MSAINIYFSARPKKLKYNKGLGTGMHFSPSNEIRVISFYLIGLCIPNLLMQCGYIEVNPSPKYSSLTFCHWNLNTAHDNIKISLLQAYVTQYNCDIICISETFLNSSNF